MAISEELEVLKEVGRRLDQAKIAYMVTGSIAANFYTMPRMTRDIDIVVEFSDRDSGRFIALFEKDYYLEPATVQAEVKNKAMFNLIQNEHVIKVDFLSARTALIGAENLRGDERSPWTVKPYTL